jgi:hypothetical protein
MAFFKQRKGAVLNDLLMLFVMEKMDRDQVVFEVDDTGDKFYFIIDGVVELRLPNKTNRNDKLDYEEVQSGIKWLGDQINSETIKVKQLATDLRKLQETLDMNEIKNKNSKTAAFKVDTVQIKSQI